MPDFSIRCFIILFHEFFKIKSLLLKSILNFQIGFWILKKQISDFVLENRFFILGVRKCSFFFGFRFSKSYFENQFSIVGFGKFLISISDFVFRKLYFENWICGFWFQIFFILISDFWFQKILYFDFGFRFRKSFFDFRNIFISILDFVIRKFSQNRFSIFGWCRKFKM